ncbi:YkyA family protein [Virgibacillus dokdonensis]|uniref:YkyA family protein n=1 Tax=Virgibacillus dokdonensis TaxID=302167 RepID=UPI00098B23FA|nr:YkyA family protein [Virgibacillus dokdonensis]
MSLKKFAIVALGFMLLFILASCSNGTPEEQIQNHLEEAVTLEEGFEEQQSKITDLEKKEQELYNQIMDLGKDEMDEIKKLAKQAIETVDKRKEAIKKEEESIEQAKEEFTKTKEVVEDLEAKEAKDTAKKMVETMQDRYKVYDNLNKAYKDALKLEKEMYELLSKEDLKQETLTEIIDAINNAYEKVIASNDTFNKHTKEYNEMKRDFYEQVGMDVTYEGDSDKKTEDK